MKSSNARRIFLLMFPRVVVHYANLFKEMLV